MLLGKIKRRAKALHEVVQSREPFVPLFVKLKLMWDCNLRCQMCNHWRSHNPALPVTFFQDVVKQLADLGCRRIHISGGEPLLYKDLYSLLQTIKTEKIHLSMTTNATLIKEHTAQNLALLGLKQVNVSLDSPIESIHDHIRGIKGSFMRATRGIQRIRKAIPTGKIQINMVLNPENFRSLPLLPSLAKDLGANRICLIPVQVHTPELRHFTTDELHEYNTQIAPQVWETGSALGLFSSKDQVFMFGTSESDLYFSSMGEYARQYYQTHPCYALWTHALIDHDGMVSACCLTTRKPAIGNLKTERFEEIWTNALYKQLRTSTHAPLEACHTCTMFMAKNQEIDTWLQTGNKQHWFVKMVQALIK